MDLIGIRVMMEDYKLIELLGGNPVHLSKKGYTKLAESLLITKQFSICEGRLNNSAQGLANQII
jgi:hypothetical protein